MKLQNACILAALLLLLHCLPARVRAEEIAVGGIHILMTNIRGEALEGAVFQVARELREGELTDPDVEKKMLKFGEENCIMALETFWTDRNMTGERQGQIITDPLGGGAIYGLEYGTYYLVQTIVPEGYNRILEPIRFTVHKYSHLTEADNVRDDKGVIIDNTLHIINVRYTLPDTASWGTMQLAAGGTGVLFSSAALLLLNRRRWN